MVDHEVHGSLRVDVLDRDPDRLGRIAHRCQVGHRGNSRKVLHQDPRRPKPDLARVRGRIVRRRQLRKALASLPEEIFRKHPQRARETGDARQRGCCCRQTVVTVRLAADVERAKRLFGMQRVPSSAGS